MLTDNLVTGERLTIVYNDKLLISRKKINKRGIEILCFKNQ
ncbi:hypothetical protein LM7420_240010 [Listeria monocytogenes]|nr:hypothetical protein LM7420_240010 [Listeria monocytogenes]CUL45446.1 hypothetical protein LM7421_240011 [Listeria monocytogenes]